MARTKKWCPRCKKLETWKQHLRCRKIANQKKEKWD